MQELQNKLPTPEALRYLFKGYLQANLSEYYKKMSESFAFMVLTDKLNDASLSMSKYTTLREFLSGVYTLDLSRNQMSVTDGVMEIPKEAFTKVTWKETFSLKISKYLKDSFVNMVLSRMNTNESLKSYYEGVDIKDDYLLAHSLNNLMDVVTADFFSDCKSDLEVVFFEATPSDTFRIGKKGAFKRINKYNEATEKLKDEFNEFFTSLSTSNRIWEKMASIYEQNHGERIPRGMLPDRMVKKRLVPILQTFNNEGVSVESIRELAFLTHRFTSKSMILLSSFEYKNK